MAVDDTTIDIRTDAIFQSATIPLVVQSITLGGYWSAGDGGGHTKVRISTPSPVKPWHSQSADGAWWQIKESIIRPQAFGAKADLVNHDEMYVQAAVDYGTTFLVPVLILGTFRCFAQITGTGYCTLTGYGRNVSRIEWHALASSFGVKLSAANQNDYIGVDGVGFYTYGTSGIGIELDFSGQGSAIYNNETRGHVRNCTVSGNGSTLTYYFANAIKITNCKNVEVASNFVVGGGGTNDSISAAIGINFADAGYGNSVSARIIDNTVINWAIGLKVVNVEGVFIELNDIQGCTVAADVSNTAQKNQVRFINNHLGATKQSIKLTSISFGELIGNEIYNFDAGTTTERVLILMTDVLGWDIHGNRIRAGGGGTNTRVGIDIVRSGTVANCAYVDIDGNIFYDVQTWVRAGANCVQIEPGQGNTSNSNSDTRFTHSMGANNNSRRTMGAGGQAIPSGQSPVLHIDNFQAAALSLGRQSTDGTLAVMSRDATVVGSISVTATATAYNTSSDETLKANNGEFSFEEASAILDAIAFHDFTWRATGEADQGVFAQELYSIYPKAVHPGGWVDAETGNPVLEGTNGATYIPWAVDYSKLIPVIARCVQGLLRAQPKSPT